MSLVQKITAIDAALYGVNILEQAPPASVQSTATNRIGMIAALPWGPANTVTTIFSQAELFATFYPGPFDGGRKDTTTFPALRALIRKRLPSSGLQVVRVVAADAAAATRQDGAGTGTVNITAKYKSSLGNQLTREWTGASGGDAARRDLIIRIGTAYAATYTDLSLDDLDAIDDPYVTVSHASGTAMPDVAAAAALAGGSNGTLVADDMVGSSSSMKGIRLFYGASIAADVLFVAECPAGIIDAVNAGLIAWGQETAKGIPVLCTPAGALSATYLADNSLQDERGFHVGPQIQVRDLFQADQAVVTVDGNAFAAFAIANVPPWLSPGGNGKRQGGVDLLAGIVDLADNSATLAELNALNTAGVAPFYREPSLGFIIHRAVMTDGTRKLFSRRAQDWIQQTLASFAVGFAETQLDLDLANQALGPNTDGLISAWATWLETQKGQRRIQDYELDPFSANVQSNLDAGQWIVILKVKLFGMIEELVILSQIGETVIISES